MIGAFTPGRHGARDYGLTLDVEVDVAIVDAGARGSAASAACAERGLTVAVLFRLAGVYEAERPRGWSG